MVFATLAPGVDFEGGAFGSVCLSVCVRNEKTIDLIDLILKEDDPDMESRMYYKKDSSPLRVRTMQI